MRRSLGAPLLVGDGVLDVHARAVLVALEAAVVLFVLHLAQLNSIKVDGNGKNAMQTVWNAAPGRDWGVSDRNMIRAGGVPQVWLRPSPAYTRSPKKGGSIKHALCENNWS